MLFKLARKNIKGNIHNYFLYFFSLVVCVVIVYTFDSIMYIPEIKAAVQFLEQTMSQTFFVLIGFIVLFISYSNAFFTKKRKKEVGLYSLLGVRKRSIAMMLFFENMILGILTLVTGLIIGIFLSRLSTMLLLKLLGLPIETTFSVPMEAVGKTTLVFFLITLLTSLQSYVLIYRFKLIELFQADKKGDTVPKASLLLASFSVVFLFISYILMFKGVSMLSIPFVVLGSYLLFRSLSVYLLTRMQNNKKKYYQGMNMIGTSHLIYRIRGNAILLTMISLLITLAIPYIQAGFSEFRATEKDAREGAPFSYLYLVKKDESLNRKIEEIIEKDTEHAVTQRMTIPVIAVDATTQAPFNNRDDFSVRFMGLQAFNQISEQIGMEKIAEVAEGEAVAFQQYVRQPVEDFIGKTVQFQLGNKQETITIEKLEKQSIRLTTGESIVYLVVSDPFFEQMAQELPVMNYRAYSVRDDKHAQSTAQLLRQFVDEDMGLITFYEEYKELQSFTGMKVFIVSALALVLLSATGSIIYFKQITEAYDDQQRYHILRKIGVSRDEIKETIAKQTLFVFLLPLLLGVVNAGILLFSLVLTYNMNQVDNVISFIVAIGIYGGIYLVYYILTLLSYNKIVNR